MLNCKESIKNGNIENLEKLKLKFLISHKRKFCKLAAKSDQISVLKLFWKKGCFCDADICEISASNGNFDLLKWAFEKGCCLNKNVCIKAICRGDLNMLIWAVVQDCPMNINECLSYANSFNEVKVIDWINSNKDYLILNTS